MDVVVVDLVVEHGGYGVGLADLLGLETLALEHVQEVRIAPEVQLVGAVDPHAAVHEEAGQDAVGDGRANLALDVVTDDGQATLREAALPVRLAPDEHRDGVHEADARLQRLLDVPLGRFLAADRQVADDHVDVALLEDADHVRRRSRGLLDDLAQVLAQPIVGHTAVDRDSGGGHIRELEGVVLAGEDRLREVLADLLLVDVEGCHELDVPDVIAAQVDVHQARDEVSLAGSLVVVASLDEAAGAVPHAHDRDANLAVGWPVPVRRALAVAAVAVGHSLLVAPSWLNHVPVRSASIRARCAARWSPP